jgi:hypothetical protein
MPWDVVQVIECCLESAKVTCPEFKPWYFKKERNNKLRSNQDVFNRLVNNLQNFGASRQWNIIRTKKKRDIKP